MADGAKSTGAGSGFGTMLRDWRHRRQLSQTDLADQVPLSQRHLSCLERGLARPGRDTVLRLAEVLTLPADATNSLLAAAGFAPAYRTRPLAAPEFHVVREALNLILAAQEPYPAIAVDRHWNLVAANAAFAPLIAGLDPTFLTAPVNVLRLSLHPDALAPRIVNLRQWRGHVLRRLADEIEKSGDAVLIALAAELQEYPLPTGARPYRPMTRDPLAGIAVPLVIQTDAGRLSFLGTTTVFGTAIDLTVTGLTIESFLPADAHTAAILRAQAGVA